MAHIVALLLQPLPEAAFSGASDSGAAAADLLQRFAALALRHLPWSQVKVWICHGPEIPRATVAEWLSGEIPAGAGADFHSVEESDTAGRMEAVSAAAFALDDTESLTFLPADCPDARWPFFIATHKMAAEGIDAVFGPAEDGSSYLTMVRGHHPALYRRVPWDSADGLSAAIAAAERAGLRMTQLRQELVRVRTAETLSAWRAEKAERFAGLNPGVLRFTPVCMERVWGGRELATRYGRELPPGDVPCGESWDVVDRADVQSVVAGGPLDGSTLHELWIEWREEIFGPPCGSRFPLLLKILDARDRLSIQVHPPAEVAASLGGEPKTEMWYIADAAPGAVLYAGLRNGVTREQFARAIQEGTVEQVTHVIPVQTGDHIFIPSGRLHAIGAGLVIFEIQQNSDTTYRVFDWNRAGTDGKPRALHVQESLACIDFSDFEPAAACCAEGTLATCTHFRVERCTLSAGATGTAGRAGEGVLLTVVSGAVSFPSGAGGAPGDTLLIPASAAEQDRTFRAGTEAVCLLTFMAG